MMEPDRDTIYVSALLACGLPPKPRDYVQNNKSTGLTGYSKAHRDWLFMAEHLIYTGLRDWIEWKAMFVLQRNVIWQEEKQEFLNWIAVRQTQEKLANG